MRENPLEILLAHRITEHSDTAVASPQERDRGVVRIRAEGPGVRAKPLPFRIAIGNGGDAGKLNVVPAAYEIDLRERLALHSRGDGWIVQPGEKPRRPAVTAPHREEVRQSGGIREIGISVEHDVGAGASRRLDEQESLV